MNLARNEMPKSLLKRALDMMENKDFPLKLISMQIIAMVLKGNIFRQEEINFLQNLQALQNFENSSDFSIKDKLLYFLRDDSIVILNLGNNTEERVCKLWNIKSQEFLLLKIHPVQNFLFFLSTHSEAYILKNEEGNMAILKRIPIPSIISAEFSNNGTSIALISLENKRFYILNSATLEEEYSEKILKVRERIIWAPTDNFLCTFSNLKLSTGVKVYEKYSMSSIVLEQNSEAIWDEKSEFLAIANSQGIIMLFRNTIIDTFTPNFDRLSFSLKYIFPIFTQNLIIEKIFLNMNEHEVSAVFLVNSGSGFQSYYSRIEKENGHFLKPKTNPLIEHNTMLSHNNIKFISCSDLRGKIMMLIQEEEIIKSFAIGN